MKTWKDYYQKWVNKPLSARSQGGPMDEIHFIRSVDNIHNLLSLTQTDVVLDVGCDSGLLTNRQARRVESIVGIDFIEGLIKDAVRNGRPSNAQYVVSDAMALPFKDRIFTKVYCYGVLHNLPNQQAGIKVIEECVRVCAEKGRILIGDFADIRKKKRFGGIPYRWRMFMQVFSTAPPKKKIAMLVKMPYTLFIPESLKMLVGKAIKRNSQMPSVVWYNPVDLKQTFERKGLKCEVANQKPQLHGSFWRVNLILEKNE